MNGPGGGISQLSTCRRPASHHVLIRSVPAVLLPQAALQALGGSITEHEALTLVRAGAAGSAIVPGVPLRAAASNLLSLLGMHEQAHSAALAAGAPRE